MSAGEHFRLTLGVDMNTEQITKRELLESLDAQRTHVVEQVMAMPAEARRRSQVPSGWTPRGVVRHLTLVMPLPVRGIQGNDLAECS